MKTEADENWERYASTWSVAPAVGAIQTDIEPIEAIREKLLLNGNLYRFKHRFYQKAMVIRII